MTTSNNYQTYDGRDIRSAEPEITADSLRVHVLSAEKVLNLQLRIAEIKDALCSLEIIGTEHERSTAIAMFHLYKGKLDAFQEILDDHFHACETLRAAN